MAAAAITAHKSGGQPFIAGKHNFIETVIVEAPDTCHELAEWMPRQETPRSDRVP